MADEPRPPLSLWLPFSYCLGGRGSVAAGRRRGGGGAGPQGSERSRLTGEEGARAGAVLMDENLRRSNISSPLLVDPAAYAMCGAAHPPARNPQRAAGAYPPWHDSGNAITATTGVRCHGCADTHGRHGGRHGCISMSSREPRGLLTGPPHPLACRTSHSERAGPWAGCLAHIALAELGGRVKW